jgi:hypothetical protein
MIPLFTPATARKDVNKTQGDGELAKLANLNRLVENVNTIVANGIPAAAPLVTYSTTGTVDELNISFSIAVNPQDTYSSGGSHTVQSYYVPNIYIENYSDTINTFTSFTLPETVLAGFINMQGDYLTTFNAPLLTKVIDGDFKVQGDQVITVNVPELSYVLGDLEIGQIGPTVSLPKLTYVGGSSNGFSVFGKQYDGGTLTTISAPLYNGGINVSDALLFTTLNVGNLIYELYLSDCPAFNTITTLAPFVYVQDNSGDSQITTVSAPNATSFSLNSFYGSSISLPLATYVQLTWYSNDLSSISINCPSVTTMWIELTNSSTITSITMPPSIITYERVDIGANTSLTSISLGVIGTIKTVNGTAGFQNNALDETSVNGILALLVSLDGTNGTTLFTESVYLDSGTNAAPTGQGIIDKQTLIDRGCNVETN